MQVAWNPWAVLCICHSVLYAERTVNQFLDNTVLFNVAHSIGNSEVILVCRQGSDAEAHHFTVYLSLIPDYVCAPGEPWIFGRQRKLLKLNDTWRQSMNPPTLGYIGYPLTLKRRCTMGAINEPVHEAPDNTIIVMANFKTSSQQHSSFPSRRISEWLTDRTAIDSTNQLWPWKCIRKGQIVICLWPVTDVYQLTIHFTEVQLYPARVNYIFCCVPPG
jgi:hypothetical protein